MPWIGIHVIITKSGSPLKGYVGVVKDVLCRQDTASGLKIGIQLMHHDPSSPFQTTVVNYDDIVKQKSVKGIHLEESILNISSSRTHSPLLNYAKPRNDLFLPLNAYMKSSRQHFGLPPQEPIPGISTSGRATPMPDRTSSSMPDWDPLSRTLRYSQFLIPISFQCSPKQNL